jgi:hypothetical protein
VTVEVRVREREAEERCPYCKDALDSDGAAADDARVECEGCGTSHHLACILELGRCTIRGCERPLEASAVPEERRRGVRSSALAEIARRYRERASRFVRDNVRPPEGPERLRRALDEAFTAAEAAEARRDWQAAADAWGEVARIETIARPGDLDGARRRLDADLARAQAEMHQARLRHKAQLARTVVLLAGLLLLILLALFGVLLYAL